MDQNQCDDSEERYPQPPVIKFALGQLVMTPGGREAMRRNRQQTAAILAMHMAGEWGEVTAEDARLNDAGVEHEDDPELRTRVLSAYVLKDGTRIWVITEADRTSTCLLLPEEY